MGRLHLFELEDRPSFPRAWRDYLTDYLVFVAEKMGLYRAMLPRVAALLEQTEERRIVDLCSGGGGPMVWLQRALVEDHGLDVQVLLTDLYPNQTAFASATARSGGKVTGHPDPVDATALPADLRGLRTLAGSLHHFTPDQARRILADAARQQQPIVVMEVTERSILALVWMFFVPLVWLLVTPLIRPFRFGRLFWTYVLPVVPLCAFWDGFVSCLRTYSPAELQGLTADIDASGYTWEVGKARVGLARNTFLIGRPDSS